MNIDAPELADDTAAIAKRLEAEVAQLRPLLEESNRATQEILDWTVSRRELRELVGDLVGIGDYARRVVEGEQDTPPLAALEHIFTATRDAIARVTTVDVPTFGASPAEDTHAIPGGGDGGTASPYWSPPGSHNHHDRGEAT